MKTILTALVVGAFAFSAPSLRADLLGTSVNGMLTFGNGSTNYFDPTYGFVPASAGNSAGANSVLIGAGTEFAFNDGVNRDTANFTGIDLTVRDVCLDGTDCYGNSRFTMTFVDPAFATAAILTNSLGVTYTLNGDVLTIHSPGGAVPGGNATASFSIGTVAATPEPGTIGLVSTGVLGVIAAARRRFLA